VHIGFFGDGGPIAKPSLWKAPLATVGEVLGAPGIRAAPKGSRVGSVLIEPNGQKAPILSTEATQVSIASSYTDRVIIHDVRKESAGLSENSGEYFAATREDAACLLGGATHERTLVERKGWEEDRGVAPLLRWVPHLAVRRLDTPQLHTIRACALGLAASRHGEALEKQHLFGKSQGHKEIDSPWAQCLGAGSSTPALGLRRVGSPQGMRWVGAKPRRSSRLNAPVDQPNLPSRVLPTREGVGIPRGDQSSESDSSGEEGSVELGVTAPP